MIRAFYNSKRGGCGIRTIRNGEEADKILKGGYGVLDVRLEDENGEVVGERFRCSDSGLVFDDARIKWYWWREDID